MSIKMCFYFCADEIGGFLNNVESEDDVLGADARDDVRHLLRDLE